MFDLTAYRLYQEMKARREVRLAEYARAMDSLLRMFIALSPEFSCRGSCLGSKPDEAGQPREATPRGRPPLWEQGEREQNLGCAL